MNMQEFLPKMKADKELADRMYHAESPEAAYAMGQEAGLTATYDEFLKTMQELNRLKNELTDEEVAKIAGGASNDDDEFTENLRDAAIFTTVVIFVGGGYALSAV